MLWIIRVALSWSHTFIVMALVIGIFGRLSALGMAIDIFSRSASRLWP